MWVGEALVDLVAGGRALLPDGSIRHARVNWAFGFDRAVASPSGKFAVIYAELGTKAVVVSGSKVVRELNRSYYCANAYEYPICVFALPDGREAIAHCPEQYNRLEIEELDTGRPLTSRESRAPDVFHSRLRASPDGRHLLSAGWIWHPYGVAMLYSVPEALGRPESIDEHRPRGDFQVNGEVESACWLNSERVVISVSPEEALGDRDNDDLGPMELGVWSVPESRWVSRVPSPERVGTVHEFNGAVLALYEHPKVIDPYTGSVLDAWPEISTGRQDSSIAWGLNPPPAPVAVDSPGRRFAVAVDDEVVVVELAEG